MAFGEFVSSRDVDELALRRFDWCGCSPPHAMRGRTPQQAPRPQHARPDYGQCRTHHAASDICRPRT